MRRSLLAATLICTCSFVGLLSAQEAAEEVQGVAEPAPIVITPELVEAHREYQLAQLRLQQYRFVELPRQRRQLDGQLRQRESERLVLLRRLRDFRPFLQVGRFSPARTAAENDQLALQATEQQLRQLKEDRINLMRYSRQNAQLYQLEVLRTATRVRELMAQATASEEEHK